MRSSPFIQNDHRHEGYQSLPQKRQRHEKYATTLPISKEKATLVRLYCIVHNIPIYKFMDHLLEQELGEFKVKLEIMKKIKT